LLQDLGFVAFTLPDVEILMPMKKPRGQVLTLEQQRVNLKAPLIYDQRLLQTFLLLLVQGLISRRKSAEHRPVQPNWFELPERTGQDWPATQGPSIDWGIIHRTVRPVGYIAGWGLVDGMDATFS